MPLVHRAVRILDLPSPDGIAINPSLISFRGKLILAYRQGWDPGRIAVCEVGADYQPMSDVKTLDLGHLGFDAYSQEDPRLFIFRGELWVAYNGTFWSDRDTKTIAISVCLAKLDEDLDVAESRYPHWPFRSTWEKSWTPWDHDGKLLCVYSMQSHVVLRISADASATMIAREKWVQPWKCIMRGGAPPVRVGDEMWSFFHEFVDGEPRRYAMGLYTFDASPPFRPRRMIPAALLRANDDTRSADAEGKPLYTFPNVIYPAGAFREGDKWVVSYGQHDRDCCVIELDAGEIEKLLVKV